MHRFGDRRHQVRRDRQPVNLQNMRLDVPGTYAMRVQRNDLVVKTRKAALVVPPVYLSGSIL